MATSVVRGHLRRAFATSTSRSTRQSLRTSLASGPSLAHFLNATPGDNLRSTTDNNLAVLETLMAQLQHAEREDHLVDTYGRVHNYLRISLTERCNLRCQYCMPEDGVPLQPTSDLLSTPEILHLTNLFAQSGVSKLRLTGGEPLVRPDIVSLATSLHAIPGIESLGITTNGLSLSKHLAALCAVPARLNISLDTLNEAKFAKITRRKGFQRVWAAIEAAVAASPVQVKLNCVVMRDFNLDEIVDFVRLTTTLNVDVRFIEWMPFDQNRWNDQTFVPFAEMLSQLHAEFPVIEPLENHLNDTSKSFRLPDSPGQFSFITSMSEHFCGGCNRLRITADGNLKVCLFGNAEVSLRDAMRHGYSDDDLLLVIQAAVKRKKYALGGHQNMHGIAKAQNRPMILIGG
ncbi:molybdenum cofactor biosynthesis protein A [Aphanomyces invadans]|uniref:GTP 3',8-cyclase n=1 Tax=Aphanomyces invadans TaxID=157072 RepID=A0A024TII9_9STRA|nr:molybdenum cofactor biosynthesis protein A [Aphanomyces invadans]ETV93960.1 molybdenum cofactor biosynthesis protein A [Aphanomyces invadans]|eukprot:XP_008877520.1 molybdenum cofactor biosynthesis protein A [Aphanomyces invadans]